MSGYEDILEEPPKVDTKNQFWKTHCATNELHNLYLFIDMNPKPMRTNPNKK